MERHQADHELIVMDWQELTGTLLEDVEQSARTLGISRWFPPSSRPRPGTTLRALRAASSHAETVAIASANDSIIMVLSALPQQRR